MTNDDSPSQQQKELDKLLAEVLDQGRTAQNNARLETLLLDNEELQQRYLAWMSLHFSLQIEFGFEKPFSSLVSKTPLPVSQDQAPVAPSCSTLAAQLVEHDDSEALYETPSNQTTSDHKTTSGIFASFRGGRLLPGSVAASVAMVGFLIAGVCGAAIATLSLERSWLFAGPEIPTVAEIEAAEKWLAEKKELLGAIPDRLPAEPYMAWPEIQIADTTAGVPSKALLQQGTVALNPLNGKSGVGYLVPLFPGHGLELVASSESREDNNIVVLELSSDGKQTGRSTSFSNNQLRSKHDVGRHLGRMGYWVDFNHSSETRYYCIVGMQKIQGDSPEDNWKWQYNDFKPFLENSNLLYLGWDDENRLFNSSNSFYPDNPLHVDHDFNDVSAVIRIRRPEEIEAARTPQIVTMPQIDDSEQVLEVSPEDFSFRIEPGQSAALHITTHGQDANAITVVEKKTGKIWWGCNSINIGKAGTMGLFGIENHTKESLELVLACRHHSHGKSKDGDSKDKWQISPYRLDTQDDDYWEIGFEDRPGSPKNVDWNDVRVCITWIR